MFGDAWGLAIILSPHFVLGHFFLTLAGYKAKANKKWIIAWLVLIGLSAFLVKIYLFAYPSGHFDHIWLVVILTIVLPQLGYILFRGKIKSFADANITVYSLFVAGWTIYYLLGFMSGHTPD